MLLRVSETCGSTQVDGGGVALVMECWKHSPHPDPLPWGEGVALGRLWYLRSLDSPIRTNEFFAISPQGTGLHKLRTASEFPPMRDRFCLSPGGEGWGEGEFCPQLKNIPQTNLRIRFSLNPFIAFRDGI
jgi:hypothetical protein